MQICHNRLPRVDADVYYYTEFTRCLEAADVQTCNWFLEQLKAVSRPCVGGLLINATAH